MSQIGRGLDHYSPTRKSIYALPAGTLVFGNGSLYSQSQLSEGTPGAFATPDMVYAFGSYAVAAQPPQ